MTSEIKRNRWWKLKIEVELILLQYQGEMGEWLKPPVC